MREIRSLLMTACSFSDLGHFQLKLSQQDVECRSDFTLK
jgi:hypothetical protein